MSTYKYGPDGANLIVFGIPIDDYGDSDPAITIEEIEQRSTLKRGLGGSTLRLDNATAPLRLTINLMPGSPQMRQIQAAAKSGVDATFTFSQSGTNEKWVGYDGVLTNRNQQGRAGKTTVSDEQVVLEFGDSETT